MVPLDVWKPVGAQVASGVVVESGVDNLVGGVDGQRQGVHAASGPRRLRGDRPEVGPDIAARLKACPDEDPSVGAGRLLRTLSGFPRRGRTTYNRAVDRFRLACSQVQLGRYTHRVAISNHRLVSCTNRDNPKSDRPPTEATLETVCRRVSS